MSALAYRSIVLIQIPGILLQLLSLTLVNFAFQISNKTEMESQQQQEDEGKEENKVSRQTGNASFPMQFV